MRIIFIGIHGRELAYSRVRCHNFAQRLRALGARTRVLTYQEHFAPWVPDDGMLRLSEREKLRLTLRALFTLAPMRGALFYLQKVHWHAAAPFLLVRLGLNRMILDYDDWDLDRSPFFESDRWNRLFFGATGAEGITGRVAARAKGCIVSTGPLGDLLRRYNERVFVIPTGVDTGLFHPAGPPRAPRPPTFIWTGKVWGKVIFDNVKFCVDCFASVRDALGEARFLIAGDGAWMGALQEYVRSEELSGVDFTGWVDPEKMPDLLAKADIGLLPLIPDENNKDWMRCKSPTKLFEFMAMGIPAVASRLGEVNEVGRHCDCVLLAGNRQEFIDGMRRLAGNSSLRAAMGSRARKCAERRYSLDALGPKLLHAIRCSLAA